MAKHSCGESEIVLLEYGVGSGASDFEFLLIRDQFNKPKHILKRFRLVILAKSKSKSEWTKEEEHEMNMRAKNCGEIQKSRLNMGEKLRNCLKKIRIWMELTRRT
uniref:[Histone H3]-lysine(79) N-trimethyltransferase n=1 Tax=Rhabditophanes sp. KR3021 TaxID=114890 RepID=A0AC35UIA0_9BILA